MPGRPFEGWAHRPGHPDRRPPAATGCRAEHAAFDPPAPVPVDRLPAPQGAGEAEALHHPADPTLKRHPGGDEFRADIRDVAGDAGAEHQPAFADLVEGGELVRQHDRIAQCRQKHRSAELDPPGSRRDRSK